MAKFLTHLNLVDPVSDASFSTSRVLVADASGNLEAIAASGGGTTNFLRADGTWAAAGGGSGAFTADGDTQITPTTPVVLDVATGDEVGLSIPVTVNKATSGSGTGLSIAMTNSAPGTATGLPSEFTYEDSTTNTAIEVLKLQRTSSGTVAAGIGASVGVYSEVTAGVGKIGEIIFTASDVGNSEAGRVQLNVMTGDIGTMANAVDVDYDTLSMAIGAASSYNGLGSSVAIGNNAQVTSIHSGVAIGRNASAAGLIENGIAIGKDSSMTWRGGIAVGNNAGMTSGTATNNYAIIIGFGNTGRTSNIGANSISMGYFAEGISSNSIAIGLNAISSGANASIAIGSGSDSTAAATIAIGSLSQATGINGIAIGDTAYAEATGTIGIGFHAGENGVGTSNIYSISIGYNANSVDTQTIGAQSVSIGYLSETIGARAVAIGNSAEANATGAIAIGDAATSPTAAAIAIGDAAAASGANGIAIGIGAEANATSSIAIGPDAGDNTTGTDGINSISIGLNANSAATVNIGISSVAIGDGANSTKNNAIAIGKNVQATGTSSVAIGDEAAASQSGVFAIGLRAGSTSGTTGLYGNSLGVDTNSGALNIGAYSLAIGRWMSTTVQGAMLIGYNTTAELSNTVVDTFELNFDGERAFKAGPLFGTQVTSNADPATNLTVAEAGSLAWDSTSSELQVYNGATWDVLGGGGGGGAFTADGDTQITPTTAIVLDQATGDEIGLSMPITVNKATSGIATGLDVTMTNSTPSIVGLPASLSYEDSTTNTAIEVLKLQRTSSGTVAAGIGASIGFYSEVTAGIGKIGEIIFTASDVSGGEAGRLAFNLMNGAVGTMVTALDINGDTSQVGIGFNITLTGNSTTAIGDTATASVVGSVAIGASALAGGVTTASVAIGANSEVVGRGGVSIGNYAGNTSGTSGIYAIDIGVKSSGKITNIGAQSVAVGYFAEATTPSAIAIGNTSVASGANSAIAIGASTDATANSSIAFGPFAQATGTYSTAIGTAADVDSTGAIAIGRNSQGTAQGAIMMGYHTAAQTNATTDSLMLAWDGNTAFHVIGGVSKVNYIQVDSSLTTVGPIISAQGETNVDLSIQAKGTGDITIGNYTFDGDQSVGAGQDNYVLTYDNTSGLISLEAATGGGGSIGGSITDNQIAVGAATANDIEGSAKFTANLGTSPLVEVTGSGTSLNTGFRVSATGTGTSQAYYDALVHTTGGDSFIRFRDASSWAYAIGVDNSASNALTITYTTDGQATPSSASPLLSVSTAGLFTFNSNVGGGGTTNFLRADGTWAAPGGGDVTKVNTPVNNEIAVWTGDGTLEGESEITYNSPTFKIEKDSAVSAVNLQVRNTNVGANAFIQAYVPAAGADPYINVQAGGTTGYSLGIDNSDSDNLKLTTSATAPTPSTGTTLLTVSTAGLFTFHSNVGGGGTTNFLRADGTWAAPAGGGTILGSVAATAGVVAYSTGTLDTVTSSSTFKYDGSSLTIGTTLKQNSGNLTLGDSTVTGNVILSPGTGNRNYALGTLATLVVSTATSGANSVRITGTATNSSIYALASTAVDTFDIKGASGISGDTTGGALTLTGGLGWSTGATDGGDVVIEGGDPNSTGAKGDVVIVDGIYLNDTADKTQKIHTVHLQLTQGQIQALNTTPIELVATPGAGKYIQILGGSAYLNHNGTTYGAANVLNLDSNAQTQWNITGTFIGNSSDKASHFIAIASRNSVLNQALNISADADATGNGGTIDVFLQYIIIDTN